MQKTVIRILAIILVLLMCLTLLPIRSLAYEGDPATCEHSFTDEVANDTTRKSAATCQSPAVYYRTCSNCGTVSTSDADTFTSGSLAEHSYGDWSDDTATCTAGGQKTRSCTTPGCSAAETVNTDPLGHAWGEFSADTATCTSGGQKTRTCSRCSATDTVNTEALGHAWGEFSADTATCTSGGQKTRTCSRCSATDTVNTEALGHAWGEYVQTTDPTCTTKGEETRTCPRCSSTERRPVNALGHHFEHNACTNTGCNEKRAGIILKVQGPGTGKINTFAVTSESEVFVDPGEATITLIPSAGNKVSSITVNGTSLTDFSTSFKVTATEGVDSTAVVATFTADETAAGYSVNYGIYGPGTVWVNGTQVLDNQTIKYPAGTRVNIEFKPNSGAELYDVAVAGESISVLNNRHSFVAQNSGSTTVTAWFKTLPPKTTPTAPNVNGLWSINDGRVDKDTLAREGRILGTTLDMVYRRFNEANYHKVTEVDQRVTPGTYYVKYPENSALNQNESLPTEVFVGNYYTVTAHHLYGKGTYYTNRELYTGYANVFLVPEGQTISFTFTPASGYWLHEINFNRNYVGYGNVTKNYTTPAIMKPSVVSFGFSSSSSSPKTGDSNDILKWSAMEVLSLFGMAAITWYLFRKKEY